MEIKWNWMNEQRTKNKMLPKHSFFLHLERNLFCIAPQKFYAF